jgi:hypothetical protein
LPSFKVKRKTVPLPGRFLAVSPNRAGKVERIVDWQFGSRLRLVTAFLAWQGLRCDELNDELMQDVNVGVGADDMLPALWSRLLCQDRTPAVQVSKGAFSLFSD